MSDPKHILGVVLARGGSKGIPDKNSRILYGKPVLQWTLDEANKSDYLTDIIVSSDSQEILRIARDCGVIPLWRPLSLALDTTPTLPALQHAILTIESTLGFEFDYIVELRATNPLKTVEDIDNVIKLLMESGAESVIGVSECQEYHPARVKYLDKDNRIHSFFPEPRSGRRQDLTPTAYVRNGSIYAFPRATLFYPNANTFGHGNSIAYIMPKERSVNLDEPIDLVIAEALLRQRDETSTNIPKTHSDS